MTDATQTQLIDFATTCAAEEMADFADASGHPNTEPGAGMEQTYKFMFPGEEAGNWSLVVKIYSSSVKALAKLAGIETRTFAA